MDDRTTLAIAHRLDDQDMDRILVLHKGVLQRGRDTSSCSPCARRIYFRLYAAAIPGSDAVPQAAPDGHCACPCFVLSAAGAGGAVPGALC
jgi:hypothetical protein